MEVELIRCDTPEVFDRIGIQWKSLLPRGRESIFVLPEWNKSWWLTHEGNFAAWICVAKDSDGRCVGIWPFSGGRSSYKDLFIRYIEPLSGAIADYHRPLVERGREAEIIPLMLEKLLQKVPSSGILRIDHIPVENGIDQIISRGLESCGFSITGRITTCPFIEITGDYEKIESGLTKSLKTDVRRQAKRLAAIAETSLYVVEDRAKAVELLPGFFDMYNEKWISQGRPGMAFAADMKEFYLRLVENLPIENIHFSALKCGSEIVSYHFGFVSDGWLLWYKPTYSLKFQNLSPSKVHISMLLREGIKRGWKGIDFLQGDEAYKMQWTSLEVKTRSLMAVRGKRNIASIWFNNIKPRILKYKHKTAMGMW